MLWDFTGGPIVKTLRFHCRGCGFIPCRASGPITSWEIDGETVETVSDFNFLGSKITADGDCSHEIKTLTPWKESYDQPR